jgi:hypothetical protein
VLEQRGVQETLLASVVAAESSRGRVPESARGKERRVAQQAGESPEIPAGDGAMAQRECRRRAAWETAALSRDAKALPLLWRTRIARTGWARSAEADGEKRDSARRKIRGARGAGLRRVQRELLMALEWCMPCKARGRLSIASHEVAGTLMCDECFREKPSKGVKTQLAAEVLKEKRKDTTMAKRIDEATREAIRKDAADGTNLNAIAMKHGVGWGTVRDIVNVSGKTRAAKRGRTAKAATKSSNGNGATTAMEELCEALWAAMPLEKKAELLKRSAEASL